MKRIKLERVEGEVWCDMHCCIHEETDDPYDYLYRDDEERECGPENWRKLWIGGYIKK